MFSLPQRLTSGMVQQQPQQPVTPPPAVNRNGPPVPVASTSTVNNHSGLSQSQQQQQQQQQQQRQSSSLSHGPPQWRDESGTPSNNERVGGGGGGGSGGGDSGRKLRNEWTDRDVDFLLLALSRAGPNDRKASGHFKNELFERIALELKGTEQPGTAEKTKESVFSKWAQLQTCYREVRRLRMVTGSGWKNGCVSMNDLQWQKHLEVYPRSAKWQRQPFVWYEKIDELIGDVVSGEWAIEEKRDDAVAAAASGSASAAVASAAATAAQAQAQAQAQAHAHAQAHAQAAQAAHDRRSSEDIHRRESQQTVDFSASSIRLAQQDNMINNNHSHTTPNDSDRRRSSGAANLGNRALQDDSFIHALTHENLNVPNEKIPHSKGSSSNKRNRVEDGGIELSSKRRRDFVTIVLNHRNINDVSSAIQMVNSNPAIMDWCLDWPDQDSIGMQAYLEKEFIQYCALR